MERNTVILDREVYDKLATAWAQKNFKVGIGYIENGWKGPLVHVETDLVEYDYEVVLDKVKEFVDSDMKKRGEELAYEAGKWLTKLLRLKEKISSKWWFKLFASKELKNDIK